MSRQSVEELRQTKQAYYQRMTGGDKPSDWRYRVTGEEKLRYPDPVVDKQQDFIFSR